MVVRPPAWGSPFVMPLASLFSPTPPHPSADPARVLNMPPVIYVPVGIHGYIRCPVDAEPPATVVKWNKDGRPLQVEKVLERRMWGPSEAYPPDTEVLPLGVWLRGGNLPLPTKNSAKAQSCFPRGLQSGRALGHSTPRAAGGPSQPSPGPTGGDQVGTPDPGSPLCCLFWQNLGWTLMEDGSIRIEEATEEALGTYTCVPYNTLGTMGQSAPARLVLKVRLRTASGL